MEISNFVETIKSKNSIQWHTFVPHEIKDKDENKALKLGRDNAAEQKYCNYINKYNNEELTKEELDSFKNIKQDVNKTHEAIGRILSDVQSHVKQKLTRLDADKNFNITKLTSKYENEFDDQKDVLKEALRIESNSLISKARHLKHFRSENGLNHRDADYPSSKILFWGVFFVVLLAEAVANAYFYAQGSDLGLLGGVLQATLIALANVVVSFGIGFFLFRYTNHIKILKKSFAWVGIFIAFSLLGFLHLVTAHYRELLIRYPDDATQKVLFDTWNNPFNISDMDSLILIIIGFTISFIVMWKAYRYDDSYPGYGKEWRKWEQTQKQKNIYIKEYKENLNVLVETFESDIDRLNDHLEWEKQDFEKITSALDGFKNTVNAYCEGSLNGAMDLSRTYRKGYNEVADEEILLFSEKIKNLVTKYLDIDKIVQETLETEQKVKNGEKEFTIAVEDTHNQKDILIQKIKNMKAKMTQDSAINTIVEEALSKAKKEQQEISDMDL